MSGEVGDARKRLAECDHAPSIHCPACCNCSAIRAETVPDSLRLAVEALVGRIVIPRPGTAHYNALKDDRTQFRDELRRILAETEVTP